MDQRFVPLLPARQPSLSSQSLSTNRNSLGLQSVGQCSLGPRRPLVAVACQACREKKSKCNGGRPKCARCTKKHLECKYDVEEGELSRYSALKRRNDGLADENEQLRELFNFLRRRPESEAYEIFTRIRNADDPIAVLNFVKQADLLLMEPSPNTQRLDPRLQKLDVQALLESQIKARSRPWTEVADDGLVSELVSSFFTWDNPFFCPFVDRECFVEEMNKQDPTETKHCTPLLVNAICASRSFTCERARIFGLISGKNLGAQFFNAAKKLLDKESGRASLPTVQALCLMFIYSGLLGTDRAGCMYRYMAFDMLRRLDLEKKFTRLSDDDPAHLKEKRIISEALWGLFSFGSISGYVYLQQCLMKPPSVPRIFERKNAAFAKGHTNLDIFGNPFVDGLSTEPAFVAGAFDAICDMSELLYEIMEYNTEPGVEPGDEADVKKRQRLYDRAMKLYAAIPDNLQAKKNFTPQTCFLQVYSNELAISILRPLHPDIAFQDSSGTKVTIKDLCLKHSRLDIETMESYVRKWRFKDYSSMAVCGFYNPSLTLVSMLHDPRSHDLFTRACFALRQTARDYPMSRLILQGLQALAWSLKQPIPATAKRWIDSVAPVGAADKEELKDVPLGFIIPQYEEVRQLLSEHEKDSNEIGAQLGASMS